MCASSILYLSVFFGICWTDEGCRVVHSHCGVGGLILWMQKFSIKKSGGGKKVYEFIRTFAPQYKAKWKKILLY